MVTGTAVEVQAHRTCSITCLRFSSRAIDDGRASPRITRRGTLPISTGTGQLSLSRTVVATTSARSPFTRVDRPTSKVRRKLSPTCHRNPPRRHPFLPSPPSGNCPNDQVLLNLKCARSPPNPERAILGMLRAVTSECRPRSTRNDEAIWLDNTGRQERPRLPSAAAASA